MLSIWNWLKGAAVWLWERPVALAATIGSILGAFFMWRSKRNQVASLKDALEAKKFEKEIARHEATVELLKKQAGALDPRIEQLKKEINSSKKRVVEIREGRRLDDATDEEIAKLFSDSGF